MGLPFYPPVEPPAGAYLDQTESEYVDGHETLWPPYQSEDGENDGPKPAVEAFSFAAATLLTFRCDEHLKLAIDVIASTYKLNRSECIRRLLYSIVANFPGDVVYVQEHEINRGEGAEPLRLHSGEAAHAEHSSSSSSSEAA
jgi:hypothetical protein